LEAMIEPPRTLSERYRIDRPLGEGGMARVFLGTDLVIGRPVAVKVLRPELAAQVGFVPRFYREARLAAGLVHPDIVAVYDSGTDHNLHYIVMELVQGRTLAGVLREGPLLPERVAEIGEAVAGALSFAHRSGVIHCDVKPANVMITRSGAVKVMDFGIALAGTALPERGGLILATAAYLSPEQAMGALPDERSDVYSLGVVLFELLTGRPPFTGDDPVALARAHLREHPPRPSRLNPEIPRDLESVVLRAMAKDPERRYGSAEQLRMDLEACREDMAVVPVSAPQRRPRRRPAPPKPIQRRSRLGMVMAEAAVALAVVALVVWAGRGSDDASSFTGGNEIPRRPTATATASPSAPGAPATVAPPSPRPSPSREPSPSPSASATPADDGILPIPLPSIPPFP
jgi:eukaryotic-like serine/threonine-protein kinase